MTDAGRLRIGLLAYGPSGRLHHEAAVALLSVRAWAPPSTEIIVLTDRPALYRWLRPLLTVETLSQDVLTRWQGPAGDRYRPKIEALRHLASDKTADVMLVDADTMTRRDLAPLAARLAGGALVMHRREYPLSAPPRKGDRSLTHEILGRTWQGIVPGPRAAMWNGGVVGSSRRHDGVFERTLAVFDEMRLASRHFAVEQLACSIVFESYGTIEEAAPWVDHYWANRAWFDRAIERFLSRTLLEELTAAEASAQLRARPIVGPLDGRAPWWLTRLRRLVLSPQDDDDDIFESRDT